MSNNKFETKKNTFKPKKKFQHKYTPYVAMGAPCLHYEAHIFAPYRIYSIKRGPRINAADGSKITNRRRPPINAAPNQKKSGQRLLEDNKKNLGTTWYF